MTPAARPRTLASVLAAVASMLCACDEGVPTLHQQITLSAQEASGAPVEGARFWADGEELGVSATDGTLSTQLDGRSGEQVRLTTACPVGFTTGTEPRAITLRPTQPGASARALEVRVECKRVEQLAALVVRASGALAGPLPVRVRDVEVGQTDAEGVAHLLLRARPGSSLRVTLDTAAAPRLRPESPTRVFQVGDSPDVLVFEQRFETSHGRATRRKRTRAPTTTPVQAPGPPRPYRLR